MKCFNVALTTLIFMASKASGVDANRLGDNQTKLNQETPAADSPEEPPILGSSICTRTPNYECYNSGKPACCDSNFECPSFMTMCDKVPFGVTGADYCSSWTPNFGCWPSTEGRPPCCLAEGGAYINCPLVENIEIDQPCETAKPTRRPTRPPTRRPTRPPTRPPSRPPTRRPSRPPTRRPTRKPVRPTPRPTRKPVVPKIRHCINWHKDAACRAGSRSGACIEGWKNKCFMCKEGQYPDRRTGKCSKKYDEDFMMEE